MWIPVILPAIVDEAGFGRCGFGNKEVDTAAESSYTASIVKQNAGGQIMRDATNKILEMIEDGMLDRDEVIMACLKYMSEDDVADMAHVNEFIVAEDEDEEDYEDDGQPSWEQEWEDFGECYE